MSETWDRSHQSRGLKLADAIHIEGFKWVQNVVQRNVKGGKPALLISENDYHIQELNPDPITVPLSVEIVWALLTPKKQLRNTRINRIIVASLYYSSTFTKKALLIDHISESYHALRARFGAKTKFIISGDINRLNLKPILDLSPDLRQVVGIPTRKNPDAILDVIITDIPELYQSPFSLPPLDNDSEQSGTHSDHLTIVMKPINSVDPGLQKRCRIIKYRPFPDSGVREMGNWLQNQTFREIYLTPNPEEKASRFEEILMKKVNEIFPEKTIKLNENDKPWVDKELLRLDRLRKREYTKRKKSEKWKSLNEKFNSRAKMLKETYCENILDDLKTSNVSGWYSRIKRMSQVDPTQEEKVHVQELLNLSSSAQAEVIANKFEEIAIQYDPLRTEDILLPDLQDSEMCPLFEPYQIHERIRKMKKKKSTIMGDIPWKIIHEFSVELAEPLCHIFNSCSLDGIWPKIWKHEIVTPVPKTYPPQSTDDLRKISGTKNLSKLFESLLSDSIINDVSKNIDSAQYGNQKGLSTSHYLVKMVHRILTILDSNNQKEKYAVLAHMVDWSKAFDRQDPKLSIESFIRCGVRPTLLPILISFFQDRTMAVKWHGLMSTVRDMPGGGPQGCVLGNLQFQVNSNDNAAHVSADMKFKLVDDLTILEKLNLIILGISSYNFHSHIASDIGMDQYFIPNSNLQTQKSLEYIEKWTTDNKMKLNAKKSNTMIFNFTDEYQFATRLYLENALLENLNETKLLGVYITSDLTWTKNTEMIVIKAYKRMIMLHKLIEFNPPQSDLVTIYKLYIRSILEQSCHVWHYSLTQGDAANLERVQKVACKVILQTDYVSYEQALEQLELDTLFNRREKLLLNFGKKCVKNPRTSDMFPLANNNDHDLRTKEKYLVQKSRTSRLLHSTIPQLQRALNHDAQSRHL